MSTEDSPTLAQRLNGKLYGMALWFGAAFLAVNSFGPVMDTPDLGWHLAQGRWMVEHGAVYRHNLLNYPTFGQPMVDEYPVFQVVLYYAWKLGWWGPCLLAATGYVVLIALLARAARNLHLDGSALFTLSVAALVVYLQVAVPLRPHLFTYLAVVMTALFLLRHREAKTLMEFWPLAILQIVWTNSHSAFVLGPALAGLFGLEMAVRCAVSDRAIPWRIVRVWGGAFLLILLACFVNPFGAARFQPVFYQEQLESIRAYFREMQPLAGGMAAIYTPVTLLAATVVGLALILRRGAVSYSLLLFAILFLFESFSVRKSWPIFGLFIPLLILSGAAFDPRRKSGGWLNLAGNFIVTALFALAVAFRLNGTSDLSVQAAWRDYDLGRTELSTEAAGWMKNHGIEGRLLHRCEDGGYLQEAGFTHGETFGDTGFGKYDAAFIRLVGLLEERPALLSWYFRTYHPAYVICGTFNYAWPYYLRQNGWRPVFYSPNSSVWAMPGARPDLPPVSDDEVKAAFTYDLAAHGRSTDLTLYGRNILTLNSMGLEDFAFSQLTSLPRDFHRAPWYWEAARILCFENPGLSADHRRQLLAEADGLHLDPLTAEFRAYAHEADGDPAGARQILEAVPPTQLGSHGADLLLKIDLEQNRPEALALATRPYGFELRDGLHWQYVAEAQANDRDAALSAWKRAVFYAPDDPDLIQKARAFAAKNRADDLLREIEGSPSP